MRQRPATDELSVLAAINTLIVGCYFEAFNDRRLDICLTTHAPDWAGSFRSGEQSSVRTREANLARLGSLAVQLPALRLCVESLATVGDLVVARFTVTGNGDDVASPGYGLFRLERGRIVDEYVVNPVLGDHARSFAAAQAAGIAGEPALS